MTIRDAVEADLRAIVEIFNATVPTRLLTAEVEAVSVEERLPWVREHSPGRYPLWICEIDGTPSSRAQRSEVERPRP